MLVLNNILTNYSNILSKKFFFFGGISSPIVSDNSSKSSLCFLVIFDGTSISITKYKSPCVFEFGCLNPLPFILYLEPFFVPSLILYLSFSPVTSGTSISPPKYCFCI